MKTKVLKTVLPIFTMLFAIGLAFATNTSVDRKGYYYDPTKPGVQEVSTNCILTGDDFCVIGDFQVFSNPGLSIPLYHRE